MADDQDTQNAQPQEQQPAQTPLPAKQDTDQQADKAPIATDKEQTKPEAHIEPKHDSMGLAIGVAVLVAIVLTLLGILAYQNSDVTTDVELPETTTESAVEELLTTEELDQDLEALDAVIDELDAELNELENAESGQTTTTPQQ